MKIITLTTDLGLTDHYLASLKGQFYSAIENVNLIDVSHNVQPFNIAQAAFYVNNIMNDFPAGTVHFIGVDSTPEIKIGKPDRNMYPAIMLLNGQYFVGCDNGIFSLLSNYEDATSVIRIDSFSDASIDLNQASKNIYIPAIKKLIQGEKLENLGEEITSVRKAFTVQATIEKNLIKGSVIHVDKYGNVIINITKNLFEQIGKENPFTIYFKNSNYFIEQISTSYSDVPTGEKLALFNSSGYLEIAINKGTVGNGGGASGLLGLSVKDMVRMEFHPQGSKESIHALFERE